MKDLTPKVVSGTWNGRLIDIGGYEGEITMRLDARRGGVEGRADAVIGATHQSEHRRVHLKGEYGEDRLQLVSVDDEQVGVEIRIDATVFELAGGGHGLHGTYEVSARGFSPLRAGVMAASKGEAMTAAEVHPETVVHRQEQAGGAA